MAAYIKYGKWSPSTNIYGDIDGGVPLVVFDSEMNNTVVISPANMFMSASQSSYKASVSGDTILSFGPSSLVDTVRCMEIEGCKSISSDEGIDSLYQPMTHR